MDNKKKIVIGVVILILLVTIGGVIYYTIYKDVTDRETFDFKTDTNGSNDTVSHDEHSFYGKILEVSSSYIIVEPNENEEERKSSDKFSVELKNDNTTYKVGDNVKITYIGGINESYPAQIGTTKIEKLPQTSLTLNTNFKVERYDQYDTIKYYPYYANNERIIYFAGDIKEFYIVDDKDASLKEYVTTTYQTFDDSINSITKKMDKMYELNDGGTTIYKSKELDLTITVCNTIDKNKDIYFDDYKSEFNGTMCK